MAAVDKSVGLADQRGSCPLAPHPCCLQKRKPEKALAPPYPLEQRVLPASRCPLAPPGLTPPCPLAPLTPLFLPDRLAPLFPLALHSWPLKNRSAHPAG